MDESAPTSREALAGCPVVADRPRRLHLALAGHALAAAGAATLAGALWSRLPEGGRLVAGAALLAFLASLAVRALAVRRRGSLRLAADERAVHFVTARDGLVLSLPWTRCLGVTLEERAGRTTLRFRVERHEGDAAWEPLRHAKVFLDDRVAEIVTLDPPEPDALRERLEALREGARPDAVDEGSRAAA